MSALGHYLEEEGIASVAIALVRKQAENTRPPLQTRSSDGSCEKAWGIGKDETVICQVGVPRPTMLVVGDSVAMAFYSGISAKRVAAE